MVHVIKVKNNNVNYKRQIKDAMRDAPHLDTQDILMAYNH